jgi:hypothetical protein
MAVRRFEAFTDDELEDLWRGLTYDDGIFYWPMEPFDAQEALAVEVRAELETRGFTINGHGHVRASQPL